MRSTRSCTLQELRGLRLHERVVSATQHRLCFAKGINLAGACLLSYVKILQKPITLSMERLDVPNRGSKLAHGRFFVLCGLLKRRLHVCQSTLLVCQTLGIISTLVGGVFHHLLVVCLGILFLRLG